MSINLTKKWFQIDKGYKERDPAKPKEDSVKYNYQEENKFQQGIQRMYQILDSAEQQQTLARQKLEGLIHHNATHSDDQEVKDQEVKSWRIVI